MKIYIAGSISQNPNYIEQFAEAEKKLIAEGFAVINPVKNRGFTYPEYIDMGLNELMRCDAIYMLKGFENSQGAKLELFYAATTGKKIFSEGGIVSIDITTAKSGIPIEKRVIPIEQKTISIDELFEITTDNEKICNYCSYSCKGNCYVDLEDANACKRAYKAYLTDKLCL